MLEETALRQNVRCGRKLRPPSALLGAQCLLRYAGGIFHRRSRQGAAQISFCSAYAECRDRRLAGPPDHPVAQATIRAAARVAGHGLFLPECSTRILVRRMLSATKRAFVASAQETIGQRLVSSRNGFHALRYRARRQRALLAGLAVGCVAVTMQDWQAGRETFGIPSAMPCRSQHFDGNEALNRR